MQQTFDIWNLDPQRDIATLLARDITWKETFNYSPQGIGHCLQKVPHGAAHSDLGLRRSIMMRKLAKAWAMKQKRRLAFRGVVEVSPSI